MKKLHLITIEPHEEAPDQIEARRQILKWPKARGVPDSKNPNFFARILLSQGMVCEIDADDLKEAETLGKVTIIGTKEQLT